MHDVISAFLDNEPFDAQELSASLATPEGRDLLLDLIALRSVVQPTEPLRVSTPARGRTLRWAVSAAAALAMIVTSYAVGRQSSVEATAVQATTITAPAPTTVIKLEPGVNWKETTAQPHGRD